MCAKKTTSFYTGLIFLMFFNFGSVFSQQDPQITQNMFDKFLYNPGVVGVRHQSMSVFIGHSGLV